MSTQIAEFRSTLARMESQIKAALPPRVPVERFIRVVMTAVQGNSKLLELDRASLYAACLQCAASGLMPDGKEAALVPMKGRVTFLPMLAGVVKKIHESGDVVSISPHVVCQKDAFEYWVDETGEHIKHRPELGDDRGEITHAYAIVRTTTGVYIDVMSRRDIDKVRAVSTAHAGPAWSNWYSEMAKKAVLKRLSKRLPGAPDLDEEPETAAAPNSAAPQTKVSRLEQIIEREKQNAITHNTASGEATKNIDALPSEHEVTETRT